MALPGTTNIPDDSVASKESSDKRHNQSDVSAACVHSRGGVVVTDCPLSDDSYDTVAIAPPATTH